MSFNPHPARRPDASHLVIICLDVGVVSILIQPEDRMQDLPCAYRLLQSILFQSSSSPKTGCKPVSEFGIEPIEQVSILIQPEDRMQGHPRMASSSWFRLFQSSSSPEDRMQVFPPNYPVRGVGFQSSSSPKTGCKGQFDFSFVGQILFQSSSSPKTGCKLRLQEVVGPQVLVSILIQPEDRMQA